jgi:hypothetical protein
MNLIPAAARLILQWQGMLITTAPPHKGVLRVCVHDEHMVTQRMKCCGEVHRDGGFSAPTLWLQTAMTSAAMSDPYPDQASTP